MKILIATIFNLGTVISFGIIPSMIIVRSNYRKIFYGFLFGFGSIIGMMNPVILKPGLFFDGRSVLISLSGLFFGPVPAILSGTMAISFRLFQGGFAATTGSLTILSSALIGMVFYYFRKKEKDDLSTSFLLLFGVLVHLVMILLMFTLPSDNAIPTIKIIGLPVMVIYPLATVLLGRILSIVLTRNDTLESLRENEIIFNSFMKHSPIYVFFKDENIRSLRLSKNYETMLGRPLQELLGKTMDDLFPSDFAKKIIEDDKKVLQEGKVIAVEEAFNGRSYTTIKFPITIEGKPRFLSGYMIDVTDQKRSEENLVKTNQLLQRIIDLLPIRIFWKDKELTFLGCNEIFARDAGKNSPLELIGKDDFQMNWAEQATLYQEDDRSVMNSGIPKLNYEEPQTTPSGETIWLKTSKVPLTDLQGETIGILGVYEDITQSKSAEEALYKLNETLEQRVKQRTKELRDSNQDLEAFSSSISHDLRAPLRAIEGFSQILKQQFKEDISPEGARLLDIILSNVNLMNHMIKGMLSISKVSSGEIKKQVIDMNKMVESVYRDIVSEEDRAKISFEVIPLLVGYADYALLSQVWTNYIANAVKYSKNRENPKILISSYHQDDQTVYYIKDNGAGFNSEYQNKLFQMFGRLHGDDEFPGTGIGLAIVDRIIRKHGGKVWAEGEEGVGATFYFSLPKEGV